jgi:predicted SprT family Zn-dependent metalloprotease
MIIQKHYHDHVLQNYADSIFYKPKVYNFIFNCSAIKLGDSPTVYVSGTCGSGTAGQVWCNPAYIDIELSAWILIDQKQTQGIIRHELAHAIVYLCNLKGSHHGRGFTQALKLTSPRLFRRDRHWRDTPAVYTERKKYHPKTNFR